MKFLLAFCLVNCLASFTVAYKCCPPVQYEGKAFHNGGFYTKTKDAGLYKASLDMHYDRSIGMLALNETVDTAGTVTLVKVIQDYNKGIQYIIIEDKCTTSSIPAKIEDTCIPDDAKLVGEFDFGMGKLKGTTYEMSGFEWGQNMTGYVTVTSEDCVPIGSEALLYQADATVIVSVGYVDLTPGIKDPSVFKIPDICLHRKPIISDLKEAIKAGSKLMQSVPTGFRRK